MSYKPVFNYTNKIVNNIARISSANEVIKRSYLIPADDILLRNTAIEKSAHSSTAIEGNPLTPEQVNKLSKGEDVLAAAKAKKEVLNYLNVLKNIDKYHKKGKINQKIILEMHKDITNGLLERPKFEGKFRENKVIVANRLKGTVYHPPNYSEVPGLIDNLIHWINNDSQLHPILIAGIAHYRLVSIHPFIDGNGRTARALATLILYIKQFDIKRYFVLDEYYDADRDAYEKALKSADATGDLTGWLDYFLEGVLISILKIKNMVLDLSLEMRKIEDSGQVPITEKQRVIVMYLHENGKIANKDVQKMFQITPQAALKIISNMLKNNIIKKQGRGPGTHYTLKKE